MKPNWFILIVLLVSLCNLGWTAMPRWKGDMEKVNFSLKDLSLVKDFDSLSRNGPYSTGDGRQNGFTGQNGFKIDNRLQNSFNLGKFPRLGNGANKGGTNQGSQGRKHGLFLVFKQFTSNKN